MSCWPFYYVHDIDVFSSKFTVNFKQKMYLTGTYIVSNHYFFFVRNNYPVTANIVEFIFKYNAFTIIDPYYNPVCLCLDVVAKHMHPVNILIKIQKTKNKNLY